ncbi:MAG TPA: hypothetical protein VFR68_03605 [Candidatus Dormibacteraeota bacterium]|nr:hypothetical protein [Candidatus Dormibacteraeota bacterium]
MAVPRRETRMWALALEVHDMAVGCEVWDSGAFTTWIVDGLEILDLAPGRVPIRSVDDGNRDWREGRPTMWRNRREFRSGEVKGQLISRDGRMKVEVATIGIGGQFDNLARFLPRPELSKPMFPSVAASFIVGQEGSRVQKGAGDS